jgi:hypothetical protein
MHHKKQLNNTQQEHYGLLASTALSVLLFFGACASPVLGPGRLNHHVISLDEDGDLFDTTEQVVCLETAQLCPLELNRQSRTTEELKFADKLQQLAQFSTADQQNFCTTHGYSAPPPVINKIIVFVHGGLNGHSDSLSRSARILAQVICEDGLYPFFIHWESSFQSSYAEHLLNIRQGQHFEIYKPQAFGFVLPVLFTDAARGLARAPLALSHLVESDWHGSIFHDDTEERTVAMDLIHPKTEIGMPRSDV